MRGLNGLLLVAKRELRERGRSKAFLISSAVTLVLVVAAIVLPQILGGGPTTYQIGVIGEGNTEIITALSDLAAAEVAAAGEGEPDVFETVEFPDRPTASSSLAEGDVDMVLIDGTVLLRPTETFGDSSLAGRLQQAAGSVRLQRLVEENGQAAADVIGILSSNPLEEESLRGGEGDGTRPMIAYAGLLLMYIAILSYGAWTLTGVTEEKNNRVVEVLLATLRPWQLLGGKVLGIGLLGIIQFSLTVAAAYVVIRVTGFIEVPDLPVGALVSLVGWFVLGYAVYAVSYAAAGSLTSRPEDAQSASFPLTMLAVAGFFVSIEALNNPDSTLARVTSFIPFTAPFVVPIRQALSAIGPFEHLATVLAVLMSIVFLVRGAARIYAGGLLRFGGRVKLREAWRSARL
ncbi:MAG TPA: ABC transporter permease [Acidimicrobiia bacterium]|nr:ABC transporter permease [Acidimicrobiia bacterium]